APRATSERGTRSSPRKRGSSENCLILGPRFRGDERLADVVHPKTKRPAWAGRSIYWLKSVSRVQAYLRSSGTVPPEAISFAITCLCSQIFISAEPSSAPV